MKHIKAASCHGTREFEIASALVSCWWTYLLHLPHILFASNLLFMGLQHMAPEGLWLIATSIGSSVQLVGWATKIYWLRWIGAILMLGLWSFVSTGVYAGSPFYHHVPVNTGFGNYSVFAAINFWNAVVVYPKYVLEEYQKHVIKRELRKMQEHPK